MIVDDTIRSWRSLAKHPILRLGGAITVGLGTLLWIMFPEPPPSPQDTAALLILVVAALLVVWRCFGQVRRLRKVARFFCPGRGASESKS